jgi:hypothetical protein
MSMQGVLARKGARVAFGKVVPGTYDPATDTTLPPTTLTVTGTAMQIASDPELYTQLGLIEQDNPTLLFTPDTVGVLPVLGMTVSWGGEALTVKNITPLAMNGTPTAARIVVSR